MVTYSAVHRWEDRGKRCLMAMGTSTLPSPAAHSARTLIASSTRTEPVAARASRPTAPAAPARARPQAAPMRWPRREATAPARAKESPGRAVSSAAAGVLMPSA
ncbi:hypothetical protein [Actinomyces bowdenii]|uniref:Uncharacterized protein n=1 Tax=Actinomyces bowdenii TaxID=131109 RepID=A0A853EMB1_9ACTO|nr:hypothetical protein [Actinomyces bowdenii]MBF0697068.1 hypothetical protein [Actinomyces bowdenii]NYS69241.1 hypothetical protein [Actinomyces bowdenii]